MANSGTKIHGKNGAIYLGGPKSGGGVKLAVKNSWSLNLNRDRVDATVFGEGNKTYLFGLKDISGTFAGLLDVSGDLTVLATDSDSQDIYLYADDGSSPVLVASGPGQIDSAINVSNTDAARVTGNIVATGTWSVFP